MNERREAPKAALSPTGLNHHRIGAEKIAATAAFGGNGAPDEMKLRTPTSLFFRWNLDCGFLGIWDRWPVRFLIGRAEPTFGARVCGLGMTKSARVTRCASGPAEVAARSECDPRAIVMGPTLMSECWRKAIQKRHMHACVLYYVRWATRDNGERDFVEK
jgi:hypothetical protein